MFKTVICSELLSSETFNRIFESSIHQVFKLQLPGISISLKIMERGVYLWNIIFRKNHLRPRVKFTPITNLLQINDI